MTIYKKRALPLDIKSVRTLQHIINITLDVTKNRQRITSNDMLRLMVIRAELEDMGETINKGDCKQ